MNEELIANLRDAAIYGPVPCPVCNEAADALESLSAECSEQARLLGMSAEREADLLGKIERLERLAEQNSIAAMQARHDERCAMSYLSDVRRIVGGDDYPDMVARVQAMKEKLGDPYAR